MFIVSVKKKLFFSAFVSLVLFIKGAGKPAKSIYKQFNFCNEEIPSHHERSIIQRTLDPHRIRSVGSVTNRFTLNYSDRIRLSKTCGTRISLATIQVEFPKFGGKKHYFPMKNARFFKTPHKVPKCRWRHRRRLQSFEQKCTFFTGELCGIS